MTQDELKQRVGRAAADYVLEHVPEGAILGVGTGTTVNCFIDAMAPHRGRYAGAVSSSTDTTRRLEALGFQVVDPNDCGTLPIYVDGADEIDPLGNMIKGGGGALTREKIVASMSSVFVCIADETKRVPVLGGFPLPVEVVPMARAKIERQLQAIGGAPTLRLAADGSVFITDNGHQILDVKGLKMHDPLHFEHQINEWAGVLTTGVFALQHANVGIFATSKGVEKVDFDALR